MTYRRISVLKELRRIQRAAANPYDRHILEEAEGWVKVGLAQTDIERLERLYRLPEAQ